MDAPGIRKSAFDGSVALPLLLACAALLFAGCSERDSPASKSATSSPPAPAHVDENPSNAAPVQSAAVQPRDIAVIVRDVLAVPPSSTERPLARINNLIHGSGRLFVGDMNGRIYVIKDEKVLVPFLDMTVARRGAFMTSGEYERGLTGFAFHPDFAKPGRPGFGKLYTASTEVPGSGKPDFPTPDPKGRVEHHNVLAEWSIDPKDPNRVDPASRREVFRIAHPKHATR